MCCRTRPKKKSTMHSILNLSTIYPWPVALHASNYCRLDSFIIPIARRLQARYYLTCAALSCIHITFRVNLIYACVATFYSSNTYWINTIASWTRLFKIFCLCPYIFLIRYLNILLSQMILSSSCNLVYLILNIIQITKNILNDTVQKLFSSSKKKYDYYSSSVCVHVHGSEVVRTVILKQVQSD